ncbi:MAG: DUF2799 domain-containing protein [Gammaproteobacteria bacterium]|nr:DUF2799 domain-containing protein [Gammaproteobacteria bacterium]
MSNCCNKLIPTLRDFHQKRLFESTPSTIVVGAAAGLVIVSCLMFVYGCASMSHTDCYYTDWYAKGVIDGTNGEAMSRFTRYVSDCSKYAITPDRQDYTDGRLKGLESYCTRENGYYSGRYGREYKHVCPGTLEADFLSGYRPGSRLDEAESRIESINSSIASKNRRIERLNAEIDKFETELLDEDTDDETRATRLRQIKRRQTEIGRHQVEIQGLYEQKVEAIVAYRQRVQENNDLGFHEEERY